ATRPRAVRRDAQGLSALRPPTDGRGTQRQHARSRRVPDGGRASRAGTGARAVTALRATSRQATITRRRSTRRSAEPVLASRATSLVIGPVAALVLTATVASAHSEPAGTDDR